MTRDDLEAILRSGPFHVALRAAIEARGLGLQRIQYRLAELGLHVGVATLSYWQQGRRRPERRESLLAVTALEGILDLPPGVLTVLLGPSKRRGRLTGSPSGEKEFTEFLSPTGALGRMLTDIEAPAIGLLRTVSVFEELHVGGDRSGRRRRCLHVVRAWGPVDRCVAVYHGDLGCDIDQVTIIPLGNCQLGQVRRDAASGVVVAELLLGRALQNGETHILEYEYLDNSAVACENYFWGSPFPPAHLVLQVRFAPNAAPVRCQAFSRRFPGGPDVGHRDLLLSPNHTVHLVTTDVPVGITGIRWHW